MEKLIIVTLITITAYSVRKRPFYFLAALTIFSYGCMYYEVNIILATMIVIFSIFTGIRGLKDEK